jgi:hypothetical protein
MVELPDDSGTKEECKFAASSGQPEGRFSEVPLAHAFACGKIETMKGLCITCFISVLLAGISASAAAVPEGALKLRELAKGGFSGFQEPVQLVITNQAEWEKVWKQNTAGRGEQPLPQVDFAKETVLLVALGRKNTGGYSIKVDSAELNGAKVIAHVTSTQPGKGTMALQALTAPFYVAAVEIPRAKVEFVPAGNETRPPRAKP